MNGDGTTTREALSPTLWRTCRALANRGRLALVQCVLEHPDEPVSSLARLARQSPPRASQNLRALNARGLFAVKRTGPWVCYRLSADPLVPEAADLVEALRREFARGQEPAERLFAALTALTHPRRVLLVRLLGQEPGLGVPALRARTGMSVRAVHRHLDKLVRRGWVARARGTYRLLPPRRALTRLLMRLARSKPA